MPDVQGVPTRCPQCGGTEFYDNTAPGAKKSPKGPDYKCKTKNCGEGFWLAKGAKATAPVPTVIQGQAAEEALTVRSIVASAITIPKAALRLAECVDAAAQYVVPAQVKHIGDASTEDLRAYAITLFIQTGGGGV